MVKFIIIFAMGVICGIGAGEVRVRLLKRKADFYESYIHRRLGEAVPYIREHLRLH